MEGGRKESGGREGVEGGREEEGEWREGRIENGGSCNITFFIAGCLATVNASLNSHPCSLLPLTSSHVKFTIDCSLLVRTSAKRCLSLRTQNGLPAVLAATVRPRPSAHTSPQTCTSTHTYCTTRCVCIHVCTPTLAHPPFKTVTPYCTHCFITKFAIPNQSQTHNSTLPGPQCLRDSLLLLQTRCGWCSNTLLETSPPCLSVWEPASGCLPFRPRYPQHTTDWTAYTPKLYGSA